MCSHTNTSLICSLVSRGGRRESTGRGGGAESNPEITAHDATARKVRYGAHMEDHVFPLLAACQFCIYFHLLDQKLTHDTYYFADPTIAPRLARAPHTQSTQTSSPASGVQAPVVSPDGSDSAEAQEAQDISVQPKKRDRRCAKLWTFTCDIDPKVAYKTNIHAYLICGVENGPPTDPLRYRCFVRYPQRVSGATVDSQFGNILDHEPSHTGPSTQWVKEVTYTECGDVQTLKFDAVSVLTDLQIADIFSLKIESERGRARQSVAKIALQYKISACTVYKIWSRQCRTRATAYVLKSTVCT
jgi:hypothetical protein